MTEPDPDSEVNQTNHEPVDAARRLGFFRRAAIRWRYRHITDRRLWDLLVDFDTLIEANTWDLAESFDELNDRYPD